MSTNISGIPLPFDSELLDSSSRKIRTLDDIPDVMTLSFPRLEYFVDDLIPRGSVIVWAGIGGTAKSMPAQSLGVAVSTGGSFLGRNCQTAPCLYLDYENPGFSVRATGANGRRSASEFARLGKLERGATAANHERAIALNREGKPPTHRHRSVSLCPLGGRKRRYGDGGDHATFALLRRLWLNRDRAPSSRQSRA